MNLRYELTKMGVIKALRNKGVGKLLLKKCIERATEKKTKKTNLFKQNTENAIYLYKFWLHGS